MAKFDAGKFTDELKKPESSSSENYGKLKALKRGELYAFCRLHELEIRASTKKGELFSIALYHVVDCGFIDEDVLDEDEDFPGSGLSGKAEDPRIVQAKLREMEARAKASEDEAAAKRVQAEAEAAAKRAKAEAEKAKAEAEKARAEAEAEMKKAEAELKRAQAKMLVDGRSTGPAVVLFDPTKHVRMVPAFQEKDIESFFQAFEQNARTLSWPKEHWVLLLSTALKGKAQVAYSALPVRDRNDYETVKEAILKAFELVPEAYRQKFRGLHMGDSQTHVEYAKEKERLFDKWLRSRDVKEFPELKSLILLEDFKDNIHRDVRVHIDDLDVTDLSEAARKADDYSVTHKLSSSGSKAKDDSRMKSGDKKNVYKGARNGGKSSKSGGSGTDKWCKFHESSSHNTEECRGLKSSTNSANGPNRTRTCYHCGKPGHMIAECKLAQEAKGTKDRESVAMANSKGEKPSSENPKADRAKPVSFVVTREVSVNANPTVVSENMTDFSQFSGSRDVDPVLVQNESLEQKDIVDERFAPFVSSAMVMSPECGEATKTPINVLRDTGASQSLLLQGVVETGPKSYTGKSVVITGVEGGGLSIPLHQVTLDSDLVTGEVIVGIAPTLPVTGIHLLLGNDLAGDKVVTDPVVSESPVVPNSEAEQLEDDFPGVFPSCVVTRSMAKNANPDKEHEVELGKTFMVNLDTLLARKDHKVLFTRVGLIEAQSTDPDLAPLFERAVTPEEAADVPKCFFMQSDVLMRKWRDPESPANHEWETKFQIVVPSEFRPHVLELAHETPMAGHLGVNKSTAKLLEHFWWPGVRKSVAEHCRGCHVCQMVGKPNQSPPKAPLCPIPAFDEPFSQVIIDCVGPLPRTSAGNEYLLTIMCAATRFPEVIPLRNIKTQSVVKALLKFFAQFGLPKSVRSDQGSNFTARLFDQVMAELGIVHYCSSAYHPQSQGALERYHQTFKNMLRTYVFQHEKDWDLGVPFLLFATRDSVQESLGFTPFELVFGHQVRGPLKMVKEKWLDTNDEATDLLTYVVKMKERLSEACSLAKDNLKVTQDQMKTWYDKDARERQFNVGDQVLVLLPIPGSPLQARFIGPCTVLQKLGDLDYVVSTPERRKKTQKCHVNMLKPYYTKDGSVATVVVMDSQEKDDFEVPPCPVKLDNSKVLANLGNKMSHLDDAKASELSDLIWEFKHLFPDVPGKACGAEHDVDVGDATPIKQHPYRVGPEKRKAMRKEVDYMLANDIIESCISPWSSPCLLTPKPDGSWRFCTDYRKVNHVTKTDSFPMPRVDDLIDQIGNAQYVSKLDLLKGYWQVPLTERAKDISAFATPDGLYRYLVTPFGMKNSGSTFQRFTNKVVAGLQNTRVYVDDLIVYSDTWEEHVLALRALFERLAKYKLTVNLVKSEFGKATVQFLGHIVGQGQVLPVTAKVQAICDFKPPTNKKGLMRFLGMIGFYRRFCCNFADVVAPLTNLLGGKVNFSWTQAPQEAFDKAKRILMDSPVLKAPDFDKPFKLYCDASDIGVGSVLVQDDSEGIEHPVCFYSKKLDKAQRNYSTIEKEALSLLLALKHFEVYVEGSGFPIKVYIDHNPLVFVHKMKSKNRRLLQWSLTLQEYNLDISHVKGKDNIVADALSRM